MPASKTTSLPNSQKISERGYVSWLADTLTPSALFQSLANDSDVCFLLESADGGNRLARYSIVGTEPLLTASLKQDGWHLQHRDQSKETVGLNDQTPLKTLKQIQEEHLPNVPLDITVPFSGGWVGYWGYGLTGYYEKIPQQTKDPLSVPDALVGLYDTVVVFDHLYRKIYLIGPQHSDIFQKLQGHLNQATQKLPSPLPLPGEGFQKLSLDESFADVSFAMDKQSYLDRVLKAKQWIQDGQVFQIVAAQRFSLSYPIVPFKAYRLLQALNPSPYAYFLKFRTFTYFGASPETCVSHQNGIVTLRALAGTRPRGATPDEDAALAVELKANEKEMAEHRMLVDLARNDVGRISKPGSVQVGEIAEVVYYTHVMHLSTEVTGQLKEGLTAYGVLPSCFPRGTVSGAPKIRAMQLLGELEPERRGVYAGMVGYLDINGNLDGAIAIRSALIKDETAHVQAGAGIVYDSEPEAEYEETRNKARSILTALQLAKTI